MDEKDEPREVARRTLEDLRQLQTYVERNTGDGLRARPNWGDLEALLRVATKEAARLYELEGMASACL